MSWRDQTAPDSSKVWKAEKDAKDSRGLSRSDKALGDKKGLHGLLGTKDRNCMEMPNLLGRRAKKWIEIAELELDEG